MQQQKSTNILIAAVISFAPFLPGAGTKCTPPVQTFYLSMALHQLQQVGVLGLAASVRTYPSRWMEKTIIRD
jgi:hypothetical protein